ncbi:hypothetical protein, partial [Pacificimonas aurantium]
MAEFVRLAAATLVFALAAVPAGAQFGGLFGGGGPKLPDEPAIASYAGFAAAEGVDLVAVQAGLGGNQTALFETATISAAPGSYQQTLAALQAYLGQLARV